MTSLAAQEVLRWILKMQSHIGSSFSKEDVKDYLWSTLKSGQVVPGYGHAVLRRPDPRFEALMDYASARPEIAKDPVFQLVKMNSEIAPEVLMEHGKVPDAFVFVSALLLTSVSPRTRSRMWTRHLAFCSTTMDSTKLCTIPQRLVSAVDWVHWLN